MEPQVLFDTTNFEKAFGEKPGPFHQGCWHFEIDGKIRRMWGWWPKVRDDVNEYVKYGHQVTMLASQIEKVKEAPNVS